MTDEKKQQQFHLEEATGEGKDEHGEFKIIPLSMVRGGHLVPTKVYTKPVHHIINKSAPALRGWYKDKHTPPSQRPRPCYTETLLTTPYSGYCHVGCKFCYIDHGTRGYRATGIATANPEYPDKFKAMIDKCYTVPNAYISSFTEPFQVLEDQYHISERLSKILNDNNIPLFYLTRRPLPDFAYEALKQNPYSYCQFSVITSNQHTLNKLNPGAMKLQEIVDTIKKLTAQKTYVSIQVNPIMPGITTLDEIKDLIKILSEAGAGHFIFKFTEQVMSNMKLLQSRLEKSGVEGLDEFISLMSQIIGGVRTIKQELRIEWLKELLSTTRSLNVTMSTCYEYYDNKKAGANLAPWFTTSDQCHGKGIPIFYRKEFGEKFQPLPGCYRKGCLYCEDYGTKACKNDKLLQASAITYKDYKAIKLEGDVLNWQLPDSCQHPDYHWMDDGHNPDLQTDAELWNWNKLENIE